VPCRACPANSLCPGGVRAQPLPRYWAASETSGEIILCAPPSEKRCLGWSSQLNAVQCGPDYDQSSYACLNCAPGSYPAATDGSCTSCRSLFGASSGSSPLTSQEVVRAIVLRLLEIAAAVIGIAGLLFFLIWRMSICFKSSVQGLAGRFADLVVFIVILIQTLAQVSSQATMGLPSAISGLFTYFQAFNLQTVSIPQACLQGLVSPFFFETFGLALILVMTLVFYAVLWKEAKEQGLEVRQTFKAAGMSLVGGCRRRTEQRQVSASAAVVITAGTAAIAPSAVGSPPGAEPEDGDDDEPLARAPTAAGGDRAAATSSTTTTALMSRLKAAAQQSRFGRAIKRRQTEGRKSSLMCSPYFRARSIFLGNLAVRLLLLGLLVLYAKTCETVLSSLDCFEAQVTTQQAAALLGATRDFLAAAVAASSSSNGFIRVNLLRSNPSVMCYTSTQHRAAGALAWIVLVVFLIGFPVVSFFFAMAGLRKAAKANAMQQKPQTQETSAKGMPEEKQQGEGVVTAFLLRHMIQANKHYYRQFEMTLFFVLALISVFWRDATTPSALAWRCAVTWLALLVFMAITLVLRPYTTDEAWRGPMRSLGLVLSCLVALINTLNSARLYYSESSSPNLERAASLASSVYNLGIVLIVAVALYSFVLVVLIARSLLRGAMREVYERRLKEQSEKKAAASARKLKQQQGGLERGLGEQGGQHMTMFSSASLSGSPSSSNGGGAFDAAAYAQSTKLGMRRPSNVASNSGNANTVPTFPDRRTRLMNLIQTAVTGGNNNTGSSGIADLGWTSHYGAGGGASNVDDGGNRLVYGPLALRGLAAAGTSNDGTGASSGTSNDGFGAFQAVNPIALVAAAQQQQHQHQQH
jgi:hypothetical protein